METPLRALHSMGLAVQGTSWDKEEKLKQVISDAHGGCLTDVFLCEEGDFLNVRLAQMKNFQLIVAGPPCPPFSRNGTKGSWDDERAKPFLMLLHFLIEQASRPLSTLEVFIVENVAGIDDKPKGSKLSPLQEVIDYLRETLGPDWAIWFWKVNSVNYSVPQLRDRIYIGGRKGCLFKTPLPLTTPNEIAFQQRSLRDILDASLPSTEMDLNADQAARLQWYIKAVEAVKDRMPAAAVACFDMSRGADKVRKPVYRTDSLVMCLTATNAYLWVYAPTEPHYNRWLTIRERAMLQGFHPAITEVLPASYFDKVTALGNAMTLPVVAIVMACALSGRLQ